jgi:integrase
MSKPVKAWQRTRVQGMYRHANGNYYARTFGGKGESWHSHRTKDYSAAKKLHEAFMRTDREQKAVSGKLDVGKMTWGEAQAIYKARMEADPDQKESTRHYKIQVIDSLHKDWPDLAKQLLRNISRKDVQDWALRHGKRASPTRFNAALGIMRQILAIGVECYAIGQNPAMSVKRHKVHPERPELPTRAQFKQVLEKIRGAGGRFSKAVGDFVEGLSLTGLRLNEAANLKWSDIRGGELTVTGGEKGTKNREQRTLHLQDKAVALFDEMRAKQEGEYVFLVNEAQKALDRATKLVGCPRLTHHDLRHYFCTLCLEEGIPINTLAAWLGHKDGGALLLRVYGHSRDEHSRALAKKIDFAPKESSPPPTPGP